LTRDIVTFGMVKDIEVAHPGITVILTTGAAAKPEVVAQIVREVEQIVAAMPGAPAVKVEVERAKPTPMAAMAQKRSIPNVRHVIAVASGKGGVGKSTVAVNLSLGFAALGWRVGLMDADVYVPSVAMMVGAGKQVSVTPDRRIVPLERF